MSNEHSTSHNTTLCISTLDINLARDSHKTVTSIEISTKSRGEVKDIQTTLRAGGRHREEFDPPLIIESNDHISVSLGCSSRLRKLDRVVVNINLLDVECLPDEGEVQLYRKKIRNVEVVVACYQLASPPSEFVSQTSSELIVTTTESMHAWGRFRVLVIGNSGVGKSSLIQRMFGVDDVYASTTVRGTADIDQEIVSRKNERFVVHDSLGFEAGDERNIQVVIDFVKRRKAMPKLEDQLHAIWLCVEIPYSGGRLAEVGVEQFLRHQHGIIGDIPLVIVLTKVDLLDIRLGLELPDDETLESYRSRYLDEYCFRPLREAVGRDVTPVAVSVVDGYSETLSDLFKETDQVMVRGDVNAAPRAMAIIAQRVNVKEKIEYSIGVGKKKYRQRFFTSALFRSHTLKESLEVIHKDIIAVWNFYDPDQCLMDENLIGALLRTDNFGDPSGLQPTVASFGELLASGLELAKTLSVTGDIRSTMAGSVASAAITVLRMTYEAYKEAKDVRILMAYIVDLVCVLQVIFLIAPGGRVTPEKVTLVLRAYETPRRFVHMFVGGFDRKLGILSGGHDQVLDKVEALTWRPWHLRS